MSKYVAVSKRGLILLGFTAAALCLTFALYFILMSPSQRPNWTPPAKNTVAFYKPQVKTYALPARLKIPKISVDAAVDHLGLAHQGSLDAPADPTSVGWFELGPRPGEPGNAVIDGHFSWVHNIPAVFDNLSKLQRGDSLYVEDEKGVSITFVVQRLRLYGQNENDFAVFNSSDGKAHLNLITCGGVWNYSQHSYSKRLVVFADKST